MRQTVGVMTDSTADLPPGLAAQWGIAVVPCGVRFGLETFQDGVDLTRKAFYHPAFARCLHSGYTGVPLPQRAGRLGSIGAGFPDPGEADHRSAPR
jgi:hypothetical protein